MVYAQIREDGQVKARHGLCPNARQNQYVPTEHIASNHCFLVESF